MDDLETTLYPRIMRAVFGSCWAIHEETLAIIAELVSSRSRGIRLSDSEIEARLQAAAARQGPRNGPRNGLVAVIPIYGTLMQRAGMMERSSGATSTEDVSAALREAQANPDVNSIILDVDSPGGTVDGTFELAAEIRGQRQSAGGAKPIVAVANTMAASAAYLISSAADEIVVSPSGQVGSIGVIMPHLDQSGADATKGVKTTLISAGKYKTEGNPFEPLTDEARAEMQSKVDAYYGMMLTDIARGRGTTVDAVRSDYGQGRMLLAKQAQAAGMADRVDTLDATIRRLARGGAVRAAPGQQDTGTTAEASGTGREAFADRLGLAAEEVGVVARHARERAAMRAAEGRKLSEGDIEGLETLAGIRAAIDDVDSLIEEQRAEGTREPASDTGQSPRASRTLALQAREEALRRGYSIRKE
jgi:capsid assembly protease